MARTLEGVTPDPVAVSSPSWQVDARATLADERHHVESALAGAKASMTTNTNKQIRPTLWDIWLSSASVFRGSSRPQRADLMRS
jgi:hypothetical protein